jgi:hypothetical protein
MEFMNEMKELGLACASPLWRLPAERPALWVSCNAGVIFMRRENATAR